MRRHNAHYLCNCSLSPPPRPLCEFAPPPKLAPGPTGTLLFQALRGAPHWPRGLNLGTLQPVARGVQMGKHPDPPRSSLGNLRERSTPLEIFSYCATSFNMQQAYFGNDGGRDRGRGRGKEGEANIEVFQPSLSPMSPLCQSLRENTE